MGEGWKKGYNTGDAVKALFYADRPCLTQHFATEILRARDGMKAYVQRGIRTAGDCGRAFSLVGALSDRCPIPGLL
jgi:hypothetical protein